MVKKIASPIDKIPDEVMYRYGYILSALSKNKYTDEEIAKNVTILSPVSIEQARNDIEFVKVNFTYSVCNRLEHDNGSQRKAS